MWVSVSKIPLNNCISGRIPAQNMFGSRAIYHVTVHVLCSESVFGVLDLFLSLTGQVLPLWHLQGGKQLKLTKAHLRLTNCAICFGMLHH